MLNVLQCTASPFTAERFNDHHNFATNVANPSVIEQMSNFGRGNSLFTRTKAHFFSLVHLTSQTTP